MSSNEPELHSVGTFARECQFTDDGLFCNKLVGHKAVFIQRNLDTHRHLTCLWRDAGWLDLDLEVSDTDRFQDPACL